MDDLQDVTDRKPFTAYQMQEGENEGLWGYFVDEECTQFYQPFDTAEEAEASAKEYLTGLSKPFRFTAAWRDAIHWLSNATDLPVSDFIEGDIDDNDYERMPPNKEGFQKAIGRSTGIRAFAVQAYSFYNTGAAVELLIGDLEGLDADQASHARYMAESLSPIMLGHAVDPKGRDIIIRLAQNYPGW